MWKYGMVGMVGFVVTPNLEIQPLPIFSKHFVYSRIIHQKKNVPM
jgi:hypothetical protein